MVCAGGCVLQSLLVKLSFADSCHKFCILFPLISRIAAHEWPTLNVKVQMQQRKKEWEIYTHSLSLTLFHTHPRTHTVSHISLTTACAEKSLRWVTAILFKCLSVCLFVHVCVCVSAFTICLCEWTTLYCHTRVCVRMYFSYLFIKQYAAVAFPIRIFHVFWI